MRECNYPDNVVRLFEDAHVNNECDVVAKEITKQIKNILTDLSLTEVVDYAESSDWIFSGYIVNPEYIKERAYHPDDMNVFMFKASDEYETAKYPLYYTLFYDPDTRERAACNIRAVVRDAVSINIKPDMVQIEINIMKFCMINDEVNYISLMATIAHELQHIFDQYVLSDRNFAQDTKDNPYYEFVHCNDFELSDSERQIVDTALYTISHNEQRGFLSELRTLLNGISNSTELKNQIIDSIYNKKNLGGYPVQTRCNDFDEELLINHLMSTTLINGVSRVRGIYVVNRLLHKMKLLEYPRYSKLMMIIGYYMYRHNMLKLRKFNLNDKETKMMFTKERIVSTKIAEKVYLVLVDDSLQSEFNLYIKRVKAEIHKHLHDIYDYITEDEILGESLIDLNESEIYKRKVILYS